MERTKERPIGILSVIELTGYSRSYLYKLIHAKKIPCHKPISKKGKLFFFESEIIECFSRGKQSADYELSKAADGILNKELKGYPAGTRG